MAAFTAKKYLNLLNAAWVTLIDRYRPSSGSVQNNVYFQGDNLTIMTCHAVTRWSGGVYTTPARGIYHCCASARCKQGGVCDFTIIRQVLVCRESRL